MKLSDKLFCLLYFLYYNKHLIPFIMVLFSNMKSLKSIRKWFCSIIIENVADDTNTNMMVNISIAVLEVDWKYKEKQIMNYVQIIWPSFHYLSLFQVCKHPRNNKYFICICCSRFKVKFFQILPNR